MSDEKSIEIDYTEMAKGIKNLRDELKKAEKAWKAMLEVRGLRKMVKKIRIGETNNYLKYHKKPMKRRRWIK